MTPRKDIFNLSTGEKVETIVQGYLRSALASGLYGSLKVLENGDFAVTTDDGLMFTVSGGRTGWIVRHGSGTAVKAALIEAVDRAREYGSLGAPEA